MAGGAVQLPGGDNRTCRTSGSRSRPCRVGRGSQRRAIHRRDSPGNPPPSNRLPAIHRLSRVAIRRSPATHRRSSRGTAVVSRRKGRPRTTTDTAAATRRVPRPRAARASALRSSAYCSWRFDLPNLVSNRMPTKLNAMTPDPFPVCLIRHRDFWISRPVALPVEEGWHEHTATGFCQAPRKRNRPGDLDGETIAQRSGGTHG